MTEYDELPFFEGGASPNLAAPKPKVCRRHKWGVVFVNDPDRDYFGCERCGKPTDALASRRGRNNRARGGRDELAVARLLGGTKVGPLGLPHDVEVPGYLRLQCKKLAVWPSLSKVLTWIDAMAPRDDVRGVTVADTPGPGGRTRRLLIVDLDEYARWNGDASPKTLPMPTSRHSGDGWDR